VCLKNNFLCHSQLDWESRIRDFQAIIWIPAFAGMTTFDFSNTT